jgi:hypothetical protein
MGKPTLVNTGVSQAEYIGLWKATEGSEPSQYLQEKKTIVIPLVAASERGRAQTAVHARRGCRAGHTELQNSRIVERSGKACHRG